MGSASLSGLEWQVAVRASRRHVAFRERCFLRDIASIPSDSSVFSQGVRIPLRPFEPCARFGLVYPRVTQVDAGLVLTEVGDHARSLAVRADCGRDCSTGCDPAARESLSIDLARESQGLGRPARTTHAWHRRQRYGVGSRSGRGYQIIREGAGSRAPSRVTDRAIRMLRAFRWKALDSI